MSWGVSGHAVGVEDLIFEVEAALFVIVERRGNTGLCVWAILIEWSLRVGRDVEGCG